MRKRQHLPCPDEGAPAISETSIGARLGREYRRAWNRMRAHFTVCPNRSAASDRVDQRGRLSKVKRGAKRGRPQGPRMKCGWGCGEQLTGRQMRALHLCAKRRQPPSTKPGEVGTSRPSVDSATGAADEWNAVEVAASSSLRAGQMGARALLAGPGGINAEAIAVVRVGGTEGVF